jgi:hypothetical protein
VRYEKPIVTDLGARVRTTGQGLLGCYDGGVGAGGWSDCQAGTGGGTCQYGTSGRGNANGCTTGPEPGGGGYPVCIPGSTPTTDFCMAGSVGFDYDQPCVSGPAPV